MKIEPFHNEAKPWSRTKLSEMLYHSFIGTIADNFVEIGWVLCFSLLSDKVLVEKISTMFGLNDAIWVVLSSTYYTARTSLVSTLPKKLVQNDSDIDSKVVKNHIYLFYMMLFPAVILGFLFLSQLLELLGVPKNDFDLYIPYFQLSFISILIAAPWSILIPSWLRAKGRSKEATILDHALTWSMLLGIFITTHIIGLGVNTALIINIITNGIPLYWFLWKKPIPQFFNKGFEFSWTEIKEYWIIVKWEMLRRLSPRIATVIGLGMMITINPIYGAIKYWVATLLVFLEGWVDAMAGLLNSHVSRNVGLNEKIPYKDNEFIFKKSLIGLIITLMISYLIIYFGLTFLPPDIYQGILSPVIYIFGFIELFSKLRYYMWLSISRSYRQDLNGMAQLIYAIPTAILTPLLLWEFLYQLNLGFEFIFAVSAIVGFIQWIGTEFYFRIKLKS